MSTYRINVALATVRAAPHSRAVVSKMRRRETFEGYPAGMGWIARVEGGYVRTWAVTLVEDRQVRTGPHGLGDAVERLAAFLPEGAGAALSDFTAELISRASAQSASVSAALMARVRDLEEG